MAMIVKRVDDFEVTGAGTAPAWDQTDWQPLQCLGPGSAKYLSRVKVLCSAKGLYFLFDCEDRKLSCTMPNDFDDIFREDVVEVFLWPDEKQDLYFEYELSPLNVELPILIPNHKGAFMGWRPWHYEGDRKIRRATAVRGGAKAALAAVQGWSAEFCIPFALLRGLGNTPPGAGTSWRANMYRIDYDESPATHWAWCEKTGCNFHRFREFGTIVLE